MKDPYRALKGFLLVLVYSLGYINGRYNKPTVNGINCFEGWWSFAIFLLLVPRRFGFLFRSKDDGNLVRHVNKHNHVHLLWAGHVVFL